MRILEENMYELCKEGEKGEKSIDKIKGLADFRIPRIMNNILKRIDHILI